jgi:anti-sigma factor RsiW
MEHALRYPETAGWALNALDAQQARDFARHLASCADCQAAVAEFEAVARALKRQVPDAGPPADLAAKTVAAVQYAVLAAGRQPSTGRTASRWWHRH